MDQPCIFCQIVAGQAPASFLYQDELVAAFLDIRPVSHGHTLVVPKAHAPYLADLTPETGARIFTVAMRLSAAVRQAIPTRRDHGLNLYVADGKAAGQEVPHVHLHVIPRNRGDGLGFRLGRRGRSAPPRQALDKVAANIKDALDSAIPPSL